MIRTAITKRAGFESEAITKDVAGDCPRKEGYLSKKSRHGWWQKRYFMLNNDYLNYYKSAEKGTPLAAIHLSEVTEVETIDPYDGLFALHFNDSTRYDLKGPSPAETADWIEAVEARVAWAHTHTHTRTHTQGRGKARRGSDGEEEEDGARARGRRGRDDTEAKPSKPVRRSADDEEEDGDGRRRGRTHAHTRSDAIVDPGQESDTLEDIPANARRGNRSSVFDKENGKAGAAAGATAAAAGRRGSADDDVPAARGGGRRDSADSLETGRSSAPGKGLKGGATPAPDQRGGLRGGVAATPTPAKTPAPPPEDSDEDAPPTARRTVGRGAGGLRALRDRSESPPPVPPAPEYEGWVKRKAATKLGRDQNRYVRLRDNVVYFYDSAEPDAEHNSALDVKSVTEVRPFITKANAATATSGDRKTFVLVTPGETMFLRAAEEAAVPVWVSRINAAKEHAATYTTTRRGARGAQKRRPAARDSDEEVDSDDDGPRGRGRVDSDMSDETPSVRGLPPAPNWLKPYLKAAEDKWMTLTQAGLDDLFAHIYETREDAEGGRELGVDSGDATRRVVISKLAEATTKACSLLAERSFELRLRARADIIKHFVQMFDLRFLQELTPLSTGVIPGRLSPKQLLQIIDCIEGYIDTRKRAVGSMTLTQAEKRPGDMLRQTRRDMIEKYMDVMGPKMADVTSKVLDRLFKGKGDLVNRTMGTRLGTSSPQDLFNLMSEHLKIAKEGGSYTLQRKLLSTVVGQVTRYAGSVLGDLMAAWQLQPEDVDVDYVTAVINDCGVMIDHLEQVESYFSAALKHEAEAADRQISRVLDAGQAGDDDEFDRLEEEQAREDLAAIEQDIPRAKEELLKAGVQITGILHDIVCTDVREPFARLFSSDWEKENIIPIVCTTVRDYFHEQRLNMDSYFFDRLSAMVLAFVVEEYMQRLLNPESAKKADQLRNRTGSNGKKIIFNGGFTPKFKLTADRAKRLVLDVVELGNTFAEYVPRESATFILQPLTFLQEVLTNDNIDLLPVFLEQSIRNDPSVSTHMFLAYEKCVNLREDLNKTDKKDMLDKGVATLREFGQPVEDSDMDELMGGGSMLGTAMTSRNFDPKQVAATIYRALFPQSAERCKLLFKDWVPPARPMSTAGEGPAQALSMDSFLGSASAGAAAPADAAKADMSSFLSGNIGAPSRRRVGDDDDDGAARGGAAAKPVAAAGGLRRGADAAAGAAAKPAAKPAAAEPAEPSAPAFALSGGGGGGRSRNRRRRGDDDDD